VPFGFVANLGVIALSGMIMRNSVILVDQIEQDEKAGKPAWEAIVGSTVRRFRPIMLTAAAAILAMIPADPQRLLGTDGGGDHGRADRRHAADLLFLPALYAAWYRVMRYIWNYSSNAFLEIQWYLFSAIFLLRRRLHADEATNMCAST
jgi:multidrug efflux pump